MIAERIEREIAIEAPVERVWALLTEAEHLGVWFGDAGADVDLRPGGAIELRWADHGTARARIERIDPMRYFSYRWAPFRDPGGGEPDEGNSTLVEFTLAPEGDGTRLHVVESGFDQLACSDEQRARNVESNTEGWRLELDELAGHAVRVGGATRSQ